MYQRTLAGGCGASSERQVRLMSLPNCTSTSRSPTIRAFDTAMIRNEERTYSYINN